MHTRIAMLVKAENKEEAKEYIDSFLEEYRDDVFDWYQIGGRWTNALAPSGLLEKFYKEVEKNLTKSFSGGYYSNEIKEKQILLQGIWEDLGLKGKNCYTDHYELPEDGGYYDILKLSECVDILKTWVIDLDKEKNEIWDKLIKAKEEYKAGGYDKTQYIARQYSEINSHSFCFRNNVFDISRQIGETIPDNINEYFVVLVDLHS